MPRVRPAVVVVLVAVIASFTSASVLAQEGREAFARKAIERFAAEGVPRDHIEPILSALVRWEEAGESEEAWVEVSDAIDAAARRKNVRSLLTVTTSPEDNANIKCQTVGQRRRGEVRTLGASEVSKKVNVGHYYIWAERKGKATTSKEDLFEIIDEEEPVELVEDSAG